MRSPNSEVFNIYTDGNQTLYIRNIWCKIKQRAKSRPTVHHSLLESCDVKMCFSIYLALYTLLSHHANTKQGQKPVLFCKSWFFRTNIRCCCQKLQVFLFSIVFWNYLRLFAHHFSLNNVELHSFSFLLFSKSKPGQTRAASSLLLCALKQSHTQALLPGVDVLSTPGPPRLSAHLLQSAKRLQVAEIKLLLFWFKANWILFEESGSVSF